MCNSAIKQVCLQLQKNSLCFLRTVLCSFLSFLLPIPLSQFKNVMLMFYRETSPGSILETAVSLNYLYQCVSALLFSWTSVIFHEGEGAGIKYSSKCQTLHSGFVLHHFPLSGKTGKEILHNSSEMLKVDFEFKTSRAFR